jgi:hypothetical protein
MTRAEFSFSRRFRLSVFLLPACSIVDVYSKSPSSLQYLQACTLSSPGSGPFRKDAPSWCRAPFEPEGLLRLDH